MAVVKKAKKKEMIVVKSPVIFGEAAIAEVPATDPDYLVGKKITMNMVEVMPESNKYYTKVSFRINKIDGNNALTDFDGLELMRDYISRMVVRRVRRIDDVQNLVTKDGFKLRVKSMATVSRKASANVEKSVRNKVTEMVSNVVKESTLEDFLSGVLSDKYKHEFVKELRRIYPLRNLEFRKIEAAK